MLSRIVGWGSSREFLFATIGCLYIGASVVVLFLNLTYGAVLCAAPVAIIVLRNAMMRALGVLLGGFTVLGSSSDIDSSKLIYAAFMVLCGIISAWQLGRNPVSWMRAYRFLGPLGAVLLACMLLGTLAAPGSDPAQAIRGGLFYFMIPFAVAIGIDAGRTLLPGNANILIGLAGCVAAIGFATDWLSRRGVSSIDVGRFILSSLAVPSLAFCLSIVMVVYSRGRQRLFWGAIVPVIPAALLITGTRTNLIIFVGILGMLGSAKWYRITFGRLLSILLFVAAALAVLIPIAAGLLISSDTFLDARVNALTSVLGGQAEDDQSFVGRSSQYAYALQVIAGSPIFGQGPGFVADVSLDTPLSTVVKLGWLGTAVLLSFMICMFWATAAARRSAKPSPIRTATFGLGFILIAWLPFGSPFEDKSFPFMLVLVFMGLTASFRPASVRLPPGAIERSEWGR